MRFIQVLLLAALFALIGLGALYVVAPTRFVELAVQAERWTAGLEHKELDIPGFHLHYLDSGGTGTPLVLVHGFGADKDNWTRLARHLRKHYRVIALDLPGYGQSDAPTTERYTIGDQVERLHAFVQAIGLSRAHFGGNSMGGNIVATYAARYPNQVASLWLVAASGVSAAPQSELRKLIADTGQNPLAPSDAVQYRSMLQWVMARPPYLPNAVVDVLAARAVAAQPLRAKQFADLVEEANALEPLIRSLPIPTHVLWGAQDRVLHVGAVRVLSAVLPHATHSILPGIGHLPMVEAPEQSANDYLAFRLASRG